MCADDEWVVAASDWLQRLADALPRAHAVVAAICDDVGRASDLLIRDRAGRTVITIGLPEHLRSDLARLFALAAEGDPNAALQNAGAAAPLADRRYQEIVEDGTLPVMIIDRERRIEYVSPTLLRSLGYDSHEDLVSQSWVEQLHEEDRRPAANALEMLESDPRIHVVLRPRVRRRDGNHVALRVVLRARRDSRTGNCTGAIIGANEFGVNPSQDAPDGDQLILSGHDSSEQWAAMTELQRTIEHLTDVNAELGEFARTTAHDLAGPLRAASGLIDLIPVEDPGTAEVLGAIRSSISRMQNLIDGALDYAHARERQAKSTVHLERLVASVLEMFAGDLAERHASVTVAELPTVNGDELQLERVFSNLIANALKFSAGSPVISIDARREGRVWRISVADQGVGIDPESRERIFELFARGPGSDELPGRGIGLATSRRIVELHGGRIWVEANSPRGSVFHFTLPDDT